MSRKGQVDLTNPELVAQTCEDVRAKLTPSFSRDQLLCHPRDAMRVCSEVRRRLRRGLLDYEILWTFLNQSKRSKLAIQAGARKREARAAS